MAAEAAYFNIDSLAGPTFPARRLCTKLESVGPVPALIKCLGSYQLKTTPQQIEPLVTWCTPNWHTYRITQANGQKWWTWVYNLGRGWGSIC